MMCGVALAAICGIPLKPAACVPRACSNGRRRSASRATSSPRTRPGINTTEAVTSRFEGRRLPTQGCSPLRRKSDSIQVCLASQGLSDVVGRCQKLYPATLTFFPQSEGFLCRVSARHTSSAGSLSTRNASENPLSETRSRTRCSPRAKSLSRALTCQIPGSGLSTESSGQGLPSTVICT